MTEWEKEHGRNGDEGKGDLVVGGEIPMEKVSFSGLVAVIEES